MENNKVIKDKRIKDFTNARHYSTIHQFNNAFNLDVNITDEHYIELVEYRSMLVQFRSPAGFREKTGSMNQVEHANMPVYDGSGNINQYPFECLNFSFEIQDNIGRISKDIYIGNYLMLIKNQTNNLLGALHFPLEKAKLIKPHLYFDSSKVSTLKFIISPSQVESYMGTTDNISMYLYFKFIEYPKSIYYFRQEGRIYL